MFCSDRHLKHSSGFASLIIYESIEGRLTRCRLVISIFESDSLVKEVSTAYQGLEDGGFGALLALGLYLMTMVTNTHIRGSCVRSRRLEIRVYRSRFVLRQSSHSPLAALAEQIVNVLEDMASRHLGLRVAHKNLIQFRRFLQRRDMEMVTERCVYVACGDGDLGPTTVALRTDEENMVRYALSGQVPSSRQHGLDSGIVQFPDFSFNQLIVILETTLVGVSVSLARRRSIPRVECLEVYFGTRWLRDLQRAAEIMVNNVIKDT